MKDNKSKSGANISFSFKKEERLCSKKQFDLLFSEGISFLTYPIKVLLVDTSFTGNCPVKAAFAVSKKNFKKAVARNRIKRKMREAYRLNKHFIYSKLEGRQIALAFIFIAKDDLPYQQIEKAMKKGVQIIPGKLPAAEKKG